MKKNGHQTNTPNSLLTVGLVVLSFTVSFQTKSNEVSSKNTPKDSPLVISARETLKTWTKKRQYATEWNLQSTGLHNLPSIETQNAYAQKQTLKYLERQIKDKLENPVQRASFVPYGRFVEEKQKGLNSKLNMSFFNDFEFRFKTKIFQGKAFMILKNPYLDFVTTASASRGVNMKLGKSIEKIGIQTHVIYHTSKGHWNANINKSITKAINARVSRNSGNTIPDETTVQLLYEKMF